MEELWNPQFNDPDLAVPILDDFDQLKEFFIDCAEEYFRDLSPEDMSKMLTALKVRFDDVATPTDDVFISVSPEDVMNQYPGISFEEATEIRNDACENIWKYGGQSDLDQIVWDQIDAEYQNLKPPSKRGLAETCNSKRQEADRVNDTGRPETPLRNEQEK